MRPETEDFLSRVRHAENPTWTDEQRVLHALQAAVAAGAAPSLDSSALQGVGSTSQGLGTLAGWGSKLSWIAFCTAATFATGDTPRSSAPVSTPSAPLSARAAQLEPAAPSAPQPAIEPTAPSAPALSPVPAAPKPHSERPQRSPARSRVQQPQSGEIELLRRVQAALQRGDGATALRQLDAHVTSDRAFLPERRAARILALCQLGRVDAARIAQAEFAREHPDSIQREAVQHACTNR